MGCDRRFDQFVRAKRGEQLKAAVPAGSLPRHRADQLVECIVPPDIFAHEREFAFGGAEGSRMDGTGRGIDRLTIAQAVERAENRRMIGPRRHGEAARSEEHTSELQSLMRISYAVFCLKKKNTTSITSL